MQPAIEASSANASQYPATAEAAPIAHARTNEPAEAVRQQVRGGGRGDHQRDDEDRADGVEGADGRDGDDRHQDVLEHHGREPERERERRIEGRELQLLPEDRDHGRVEHEHGGHHEQRGGAEVPAPRLEPVERRERELAEQDRIRIEVHPVRVAGDDDHAEREERREDEPDRGVLLHEPRRRHELDERHGDDAGERRADEQER